MIRKNKILLTRSEVAEIIGVTWQTVWRWTNEGKLHGIKLGEEKQSRVLYKYTEIKKFIKKYGTNI